MPITVVVGAQNGDEGKGKVVDIYSPSADYVSRYYGGANAGHTIINHSGEYKLHLIPGGILRGKPSVLANGMVIEPNTFVEEVRYLLNKGIAVRPGLLMVSDRAHFVMPWHLLEDEAVENSSGRGGVGSTKRGIAYAYADKMRRRGFRPADFLARREQMTARVCDRMVQERERIRFMYGANLDYAGGLNKTLVQCVDAICQLLPYVTRTEEVLRHALKDGAHLLFEGAQGYYLDIDFGRYPYVTSSSPCAGGIYQGAGIPPTEVPRVIGVAKVYETYVGSGPFPTEFDEDLGGFVRSRGKEFGTTTGRPRRVGWLDIPMLRTSVEANGCEEIILVKTDILSGLSSLKIAVGYNLNGERCDYVPSTAEEHALCAPVYREVPGWDYPLEQAKSLGEIEQNAPQLLEYARMIESRVGARVIALSTGPHHDQTFFF
ncbi:adenylosuccinate synthase [Candidatus Uhrbacteria bacterium]|nr:adenylosuccinate synthase [Candidatus Uhrbacteria bacterium]